MSIIDTIQKIKKSNREGKKSYSTQNQAVTIILQIRSHFLIIKWGGWKGSSCRQIIEDFFNLFKQPKTIVGNKTRGLGISSLSIGTFLLYIVLALHFYFSSDRLFYSCFQISHKALQCQTFSDWVLTMTVN